MIFHQIYEHFLLVFFIVYWWALYYNRQEMTLEKHNLNLIYFTKTDSGLGSLVFFKYFFKLKSSLNKHKMYL